MKDDTEMHAIVDADITATLKNSWNKRNDTH